MSDSDDGRQLAVGAGSPADPDRGASGPAGDCGGAGRAASPGDPDGAPAADPPVPPGDDVVQAVADFVDDLVDPATERGG